MSNRKGSHGFTNFARDDNFGKSHLKPMLPKQILHFAALLLVIAKMNRKYSPRARGQEHVSLLRGSHPAGSNGAHAMTGG